MMIPVPLCIERQTPDTSFGQDMHAIESRLESARRWRQRRRLLRLRTILFGRSRRNAGGGLRSPRRGSQAPCRSAPSVFSSALSPSRYVG